MCVGMGESQRQIPTNPVIVSEGVRKKRLYRTRYVIMAVLGAGMLLHLEIGFAQPSVPETILVQVLDERGHPETNAECFGDVRSDGLLVYERRKPLRPLSSIYDVVDQETFVANVETGFYALDLNFITHVDDYEIRIVCYPPDYKGISYTIITSDNRSGCSLEQGGKLMICQ